MPRKKAAPPTPPTPGAEFLAEIRSKYDLSPHEGRLVELAAASLDRAMQADDEFRRYVEETGSVIHNGKAHPASVIARDSARAFELLCRSANLPADTNAGASVRRLREAT
jgi:hypothetical protein